MTTNNRVYVYFYLSLFRQATRNTRTQQQSKHETDRYQKVNTLYWHSSQQEQTRNDDNNDDNNDYTTHPSIMPILTHTWHCARHPTSLHVLLPSLCGTMGEWEEKKTTTTIRNRTQPCYPLPHPYEQITNNPTHLSDNPDQHLLLCTYWYSNKFILSLSQK